MNPYLCEICRKPLLDYEPTYCCNGIDCGCKGLPVEPAICSERCWDVLINAARNYDDNIEERRIKAGIEIFNPKQKILFE